MRRPAACPSAGPRPLRSRPGPAAVPRRHRRYSVRVVVAGEVRHAVHQLRAVAAADVAEPALRRHVVERDPDRADHVAAQVPVGGVVVPVRKSTNESVLVTNAP